LIIASINSLAKSIPPALLVALVEKGMWVQAQGLAYARQIPNPEQRAEALAGLIHLLKEPLRKQALREMWTTAQVIGEGRDRSLALSMLAAYLSEPLKEQVLRQALVAAKSAWHASGFAQAMTKLAPHLRESLLLEALGVAQKLPAQHFMHVGFSPQAEALVRLFPRLVELGHSDKALAAARAVSVDCGRARALTGLISHLTEPLKGQILQEALVATRVLDDDESRAWNFLELFFHVSEPQKEQVLREALAAAQKLSRVSWWGNPSRQERLLISLVPQLAELGYIDEALAMAQAMEGTFGQALTLTKLLPFLPEPLRGQTLQKELAVARSIRLGRDRAEALSRLISQLSNPLRQEIAHEALAAVQEIGSNEEQNEVLSALIPYLSKPLLSEALVVVHGVGDKKSQIRALLGIASHMPGFLLQQALVAVQETNDHQLRLEALLKLATRLPEPIREQVLQDALAALHMIQRADDRAHVLSSLAVYLPEPFLREALAAAQETQHEGVWAQLLWSLAPHLPEHLLLEALAAAREIENEGYRAEALAGFAVRLAELGYPMEALDVAREISDLSPHQLDGPTGIVHIRDEQWRAKAILGLAPHLPEPLLLETLVLARAICARDERARALSGLTPYLPESLRDQVSHEALAMAETIEDDQLKVDIFLKLMPWLVEPVKAQAMQAMLVATQSIGPISDKAMTLLKLVSDSSSQLPESMREQKLWEALAITRVLCDQDDRAEVLAELGPCLGKFSPTTCYDLWRETIHVSACGARMDLLSDLGVLEPVIFALGGEKAIAETFRDIQDVGRWWP
jgi:hypothetical protein